LTSPLSPPRPHASELSMEPLGLTQTAPYRTGRGWMALVSPLHRYRQTTRTPVITSSGPPVYRADGRTTKGRPCWFWHREDHCLEVPVSLCVRLCVCIYVCVCLHACERNETQVRIPSDHPTLRGYLGYTRHGFVLDCTPDTLQHRAKGILQTRTFKIQDSRFSSLIVTYTYRICSEMTKWRHSAVGNNQKIHIIYY